MQAHRETSRLQTMLSVSIASAMEDNRAHRVNTHQQASQARQMTLNPPRDGRIHAKPQPRQNLPSGGATAKPSKDPTKPQSATGFNLNNRELLGGALVGIGIFTTLIVVMLLNLPLFETSLSPPPPPFPPPPPSTGPIVAAISLPGARPRVEEVEGMGKFEKAADPNKTTPSEMVEFVCFNISTSQSWPFKSFFVAQSNPEPPDVEEVHRVEFAVADAFGCQRAYNADLCRISKNASISVLWNDVSAYCVCVGSTNQAHSDELTDVIDNVEFFNQLINNGLPPFISLTDAEVVWQAQPRPVPRPVPSPVPRPVPSPEPAEAKSPSIANTAHVVTIHQLVTKQPDLDLGYDFFLWENDPFVLQFATGCGVTPSDAVALVKYGTNCPFATDTMDSVAPAVLSHVGRLNADLRTALALPAGIYQLCLQQGAQASDALVPYVKHPRIRAIANYKTVG